MAKKPKTIEEIDQDEDSEEIILVGLDDESRKQLGLSALTPEQRKKTIEEHKARHDWEGTPEGLEHGRLEREMALVDWGYWKQVPSLTAQEFCILRHVHDPRKFVDDKNATPGDDGKTLGERVGDDVRIIERALRSDAKKPVIEWVLWAQQQGWDLPSYLSILASAEGESSKANSDYQKLIELGARGDAIISNVRPLPMNAPVLRLVKA